MENTGIPLDEFFVPVFPTCQFQDLQSSCSAVSQPIFASKYSLESSRRDRHNTLRSRALESHLFGEKSLPEVCQSSKFLIKISLILPSICQMFINVAVMFLDVDEMWEEFVRDSPNFVSEFSPRKYRYIMFNNIFVPVRKIPVYRSCRYTFNGIPVYRYAPRPYQ